MNPAKSARITWQSDIKGCPGVVSSLHNILRLQLLKIIIIAFAIMSHTSEKKALRKRY